MAEVDLQRRIMVLASSIGQRLFRNNVGLMLTADGRRIRTGLMPGSGDLIGWTTVTITPTMIGQRIAVFTSVECKSKGSKLKPNQLDFYNAVRSAGGKAIVAWAETDYERGIV